MMGEELDHCFQVSWLHAKELTRQGFEEMAAAAAVVEEATGQVNNGKRIAIADSGGGGGKDGEVAVFARTVLPDDIRQDDIDSTFYHCPICLRIARDPVEVKCCLHWYCAGCFLRLLSRQSHAATSRDEVPPRERFHCAYCRRMVNVKDSTTAQPSISRTELYDRLSIQCSFSCDFSAKIADVQFHETWCCSLRPVHCPFRDCNEVHPAKNLGQHLVSCYYREVYCPSCNLPVQCRDFPLHNCIYELKRTIHSMEAKLRVHGLFGVQEKVLGTGGGIVVSNGYQSGRENHGQSPIDIYCSRFGKEKRQPQLQYFRGFFAADGQRDATLPSLPPTPPPGGATAGGGGGCGSRILSDTGWLTVPRGRQSAATSSRVLQDVIRFLDESLESDSVSTADTVPPFNSLNGDDDDDEMQGGGGGGGAAAGAEAEVLLVVLEGQQQQQQQQVEVEEEEEEERVLTSL